MMLQLNPQLPVFVDGMGAGYAFALIDYSQDHNLHFVVALNNGGDVWIVPNDKVKAIKNYSLFIRVLVN